MDVPPLWRSDTSQEGACQSLHRQVSQPQEILKNRAGLAKKKNKPWVLTLSFLGFSHQFVVFLRGQQHGFPLCIVLKQNPLCDKVPLSSSSATALNINTHRTRGPSWPYTTSPPRLCRVSWFPSCHGRTCESSRSHSNILACSKWKETCRVSYHTDSQPGLSSPCLIQTFYGV